jgi:hypothetical protein
LQAGERRLSDVETAVFAENFPLIDLRGIHVECAPKHTRVSRRKTQPKGVSHVQH